MCFVETEKLAKQVTITMCLLEIIPRNCRQLINVRHNWKPHLLFRKIQRGACGPNSKRQHNDVAALNSEFRYTNSASAAAFATINPDTTTCPLPIINYKKVASTEKMNNKTQTKINEASVV